jgi:hypothetical protein
MRALLKAHSLRLFDEYDRICETRLGEGGLSWTVMGELWGRRLMDGDGLGWIDIDIGMASTV